jgi:TatD DNase family protein
VIARAVDAGVQTMMAIGTGSGPPDLEAGVALADRYPFFYATVGIHPHDAGKATPETFRRLEDLTKHPKVLAIGEIGLDYHYDFSPPEIQRDVFITQIELAKSCGKPIVIHTREAWDDTMRLLKEHWVPAGRPGIMHCFSGGPEEARQCLDMGFYLSFAGIVTFPKATAIREAAKVTPRERLLIETDAPYLAPVPNRGKRNEPAFIVETAKRLAALRGESFEELAAATTRNFQALCLLQPTPNG